MRRILAATAVLLLTASVSFASPMAIERRVTVVVGWDNAAAATRSSLQSLAGAQVLGTIPLLDVQKIELPASSLDLYRSSPAVDFVEPNKTFAIFDEPSDPLLQFQWPMDLLGVVDAWKTETGARSPVLVAVVDTGVDGSHPDLAGRLRPGIDLVDLDQDPTDDHGHGTHIAGVIAANTDNRLGVAGMSWGAKILPVKVCDKRGACDGFSVAAGIIDAILAGAKVVNLSLGGASTGCSDLETLTATLAEQRRVLLIASSGNSGDADNPINYPAACPGYMGVGATDSTDTIAAFSSYGDYVDVTAPGVTIFSTLPPSKSKKGLYPGYGFMSGTSMAAPHVSALAALLFSQNPDWTPAQVQERIESTAVDLGPKGRDDKYGHGRINVKAALKKR